MSKQTIDISKLQKKAAEKAFYSGLNQEMTSLMKEEGRKAAQAIVKDVKLSKSFAAAISKEIEKGRDAAAKQIAATALKGLCRSKLDVYMDVDN